MAASESSILLRGGTIIQHDASDSITTPSADILIAGNRIKTIGSSLQPIDDSTVIVDCTSKIISPGFIDTHHHLWQTQLKGRHADEVLTEYLWTGNFTASLFEPIDAFWANLGGGLEALSAGTTSLVDHSHVAHSPQHIRAALDGLVSSGLRGVFCPAFAGRVKSWAPKFALDEDMVPAWFEKTVFDDLATEGPWGDGAAGKCRVKLGLAFDGIGWVPDEMALKVYGRARNAGMQLITSHFTHIVPDTDPLAPLEKLKLLGPDILLSHFTGASAAEAALASGAGVHISTTPSTELQMALGTPACFRDDVSSQASFGVDCHSATAASIASEMRMGLQSARVRLDQPKIEAKPPQDPGHAAIPVREAFNLATVKGARAIRMGDDVGALREGMLADVVVWDGTSPGMVCAAVQDPVAAVVLHSSVADVNMVIIDGVIRKEGGQLKSSEVSITGDYGMEERRRLQWVTVVEELLASRERYEKR